MKIMANFKCSACAREVERRIENDVKEIECECGEVMVKLITTPRYFDNSTGRSPAAKY